MGEARRRLTAHELRQVAVEAGCDPRTVGGYWEKGPDGMNSTTVARVRAALVKLGFEKP